MGDETQHTLSRFEATGMDERMADDYEALLAILNDAVKQQRAHAPHSFSYTQKHS